VATRVKAIESILIHNHNAFLIEPDNSNELVMGIKAMISNKEMAEKLATQAYKDVKAYTWGKRVEEILIRADRLISESTIPESKGERYSLIIKGGKSLLKYIKNLRTY
jgi:glycosyltransferase involved in cell wall biosynthesis